ncbi:MAG: Gfo/Idh/MocA family oxidoreductase, partial [Clostridia bacterium]
MDKIKVAIIGCGMIAESHAKALLSDPRAQLVAAAYGTNKARGDAFGERFGVPKIVGDYRELLNDKLDMVCICTPSGLHAACAIDFAHAGVNVLCEKPLDIKSGAMTDMITAARGAGVKLGCVFSNRTRPGIKRAKELLQAGELGDMRIVECQYRGYRSPAYYTSSKWKGTRAMDGGGCLINQGIHAIDLMMYLCGDVSSVCAQVGALGRDIEVEDTAAALLAFQNGAQGVIMG